MISPVLTIAEGVKIKKQNKTKIGVGSVLKSKVLELKKITMEGRIMRMSKEVVKCVQDVVRKKKFLVQFQYGKKKEISYNLLLILSLKEEFEMDEPLSYSTKKEQGEILAIVGDPEVG